jgi:hypothetical protein
MPIFQYATRAGESTWNFQIDLIGAQTLFERPANQRVGRYTFADGGSGKKSESLGAALPLDNGGVLGVAWNKPLGREAEQCYVTY